MKTPIIGIDLGTTNSAVACVRNGKAHIIPVDGAQTMPSCVGLGPDGTVLVGTAALRQYSVYPERTIKSVKRRMGLESPVTLGDRTFSPEQISALILGKLKQAAEQFFNQPVTRAVITVPAYFNENQRKATRTAGELAGLIVERILNEPTAAALAYSAQGGDCKNVLVYDLGGGTFDASLVCHENGIMEVKASHGDTALGGDDFDELLVVEAAQRFKTSQGSDPIASQQHHNRLREIMERAKIQLSDQPFALVEEALFFDGKNLSVECSRSDYESAIFPLIEKTMDSCEKCLKDARLSASQLDLILLAGGASRTPVVHEMIEARFNQMPRHEINPDLIVAIGAALQASQLDGEFAAAVLVDITPHDLGILAIHDWGQLCFTPIIRRNSPLPANKSEVFYTATDGQCAVNIEVFQGASGDASHNEFLGNLRIDGLDPDAPENSPVIVHFSLNLNGMLEVVATEKNTGLSKLALLNTTNGNSAAHDAKTNADILPLLPSPNFVADDASPRPDHSDPDSDHLIALTRRAQTIVEAAQLDPDDLTEIVELNKLLLNAIELNDADAIADRSEQLEELLFFLEE